MPAYFEYYPVLPARAVVGKAGGKLPQSLVLDEALWTAAGVEQEARRVKHMGGANT